MRLFYATTNPGKLFEVGKFLKPFGVELIGPRDLGLTLDIEEAGQTLEENATLKTKAYLDAGVDMPVISDDTGIEIDALGGEPGIYAGRWRDKKRRMTDEEIIAYCLERMRGIPASRRTATFRTVIALGIPNCLKRTVLGVRQGQSLRDIELFDGVLRGVILEKAAPLRIKGFPFESLFYIPEWKKVLGDVHQLPNDQKKQFLSHRERAVKKAIPRIRELFTPLEV